MEKQPSLPLHNYLYTMLQGREIYILTLNSSKCSLVYRLPAKQSRKLIKGVRCFVYVSRWLM